MTYFILNKNSISYLGDNFKKWFGSMPATPKKVNLVSHLLPRWMTDDKIQKEFKIQECTLNDVAWAMKNDKKLKDKWNIFYVNDKDKILRAVNVYWIGDGWFVNAFALDDYKWNAGYRIFSRNSSFKGCNYEKEYNEPWPVHDCGKTATTPTQESWSDRFDNDDFELGTTEDGDNIEVNYPKLKSFIQTILQEERQKVLDILLEKMPKKKEVHWKIGSEHDRYNSAIQEITDIINQMKNTQ